jgi:hypothetical protein
MILGRERMWSDPCFQIVSVSSSSVRVVQERGGQASTGCPEEAGDTEWISPKAWISIAPYFTLLHLNTWQDARLRYFSKFLG